MNTVEMKLYCSDLDINVTADVEVEHDESGVHIGVVEIRPMRLLPSDKRIIESLAQRVMDESIKEKADMGSEYL